jgi:hypothetical protein
LDKNEKRYFKLFATMQKGRKKYIKLFDAINQQKRYDEKAIKNQLAGEKLTKNFSVTKNYLYNLILKSLQHYHSKQTIEKQIYEHLETIEILFSKRLFDQCLRHIKKTKTLALEYEKFDLSLVLYRWERVLIRSTFFNDTTSKEIKQQREQEKQVLEQLSTLLQYIYRSFMSQHFIFEKGVIRSQEEYEELNTLFQEIQQLPPPEGYRMKLHNQLTHSIYHYSIGDWKKLRHYYLQSIDLMDQNPKYTKENLSQYIAVLNNYLGTFIELREPSQQFFNGLEKLRALPEQKLYKNRITQDIYTRTFSRSYMLELSMYRVTGQFNKGVELIPEILQQIKNQKLQLSAHFSQFFKYNYAVLYFGAQQYNPALEYLNNLLDSFGGRSQRDIVSSTKLLELIIHFELGHNDLLPHLVRSTYRFLKKGKNLFRVERVLLDFIRLTLPKVNFFNAEEKHQAFRQLKEKFLPLTNDTYEKRAFDYFDYIAWLDSHLQDCSYAEALQQRNAALQA